MIEIYIVGGWVRDRLIAQELGVAMPPADRDFVVVGASEKDLTDLGYAEVGNDFPVFLHPVTHEEYALARTERKTGAGYAGFATETRDVTLEEDLRRRDLTVNAIAFDGKNYIDPYGGIDDIRRRILRQVSDAFDEDPVRILRCARFAASLPGFTIEPGTLLTMRGMVDSGEADALTGERVMKEMGRAMMLANAEVFLRVLVSTGLVERAWPEIASDIDLDALAFAAQHDTSMEVRFACLLHRTRPEAAASFLAKIRAPKAIGELVAVFHGTRHLFTLAKKPEAMLMLFEKADAFRRPERFMQVLAVSLCLGEDAAVPFERALSAARAVDAGAIARRFKEPKAIAQALHDARLAAIKGRLP